jgi:hypothetical protein
VVEAGDRLEAQVDGDEDRCGHEPQDDDGDSPEHGDLEEDDRGQQIRDRAHHRLDDLVDARRCVGRPLLCEQGLCGQGDV